jgi:hypothetical protein
VLIRLGAKVFGLTLALLPLVVLLGADLHKVSAHAADGHPVRLQEGTCDNPGPVAYSANGVGATVSLDGRPIPAAAHFGSDRAIPMQTSETTFETNLSSFIKGDHAIVVYESDEAMDEEIACGTIGGALTVQMAGMVMPGDELASGLAEVNDSGHSGIALFRADGPNSTLRIFLMDTVEAAAGVAAATPGSG